MIWVMSSLQGAPVPAAASIVPQAARAGGRPREGYSLHGRMLYNLFSFAAFLGARKSTDGTSAGKGRIQEIDIAKGLACLLMIAAHIMPRKVLPFGTFAAPLFFACSGMNTILLIEKTKGNRCYDLFHLVFPLLLFFGGSTQVVIVHGGRLRVIPEFLQCIALSLLLIFALSKSFKDPRRCGMLFPVPFLIKGLQSWLLPGSFSGLSLEFIIGGNFSMFPWLGFFLFGIFLLGLQRSSLPWLAAVLASAFILSFAAPGYSRKNFTCRFPTSCWRSWPSLSPFSWPTGSPTGWTGVF